MKWYEKQKHLYAAKIAAEQAEEVVNSDEQAESHELPDYENGINTMDTSIDVEESMTDIVDNPKYCEPETASVRSESNDKFQKNTFIGKDVVIHGDLESENNLQFYGVIEGNMKCQGQLWLSGAVTGNVECGDAHLDNVIISGDLKSNGQVQLMKESTLCGNATALNLVSHGRIKGNVIADNSIKVMKTGAIIGDVTCEELEIERGAVIQGAITMKH